MEQNYKKDFFKKLLDRLQEDSWQLELLISGFAIFGLFYTVEPLSKQITEARFSGDSFASVVYQVVAISVYILIFNLLLHIVLRGLWIGALGLRYVSGDIDYDKLNYSEKFTNYLKKRVGSFDDYIGKLENICSVIFAISFLLVFYVIAFFIVFYFSLFIAQQVFPGTNPPFLRTIGVTFFYVVVVGAVLTFFDFITQGLLKKNKWVAKIYFPIYWVFSFLTLSFLYRPLSYNLLDNKFGKRINLMLLPFYLSILIISTLYNRKSNYIYRQSTIQSSVSVANNRNYEDLVAENELLFLDAVAIQSKVITDSYVKVTIPLNDAVENRVFKFNESIIPEKDKRGLHSGISITFTADTKQKERDSLREEYLKTFNKIYSIKIDTTSYKSDFVITSNDRTKFSFDTYIGIKDLTEGKHILECTRLKHKDTDSLVSIRKIPFWYYKD